ncbi:protein of unknown function [Polaromonas sp. YR568]|uniref:DUF4136 domain-containing protein n=1 Tax=Polaromonas sp. YR568 TaxID=1855301 RepID=UPI0008EF3164|nr:DUF4136 domain-containing protein [Polaromonas sp. YR568]SFU84118.1 protein of unknown function [Polaromonas sp. YR568]
MPSSSPSSPPSLSSFTGPRSSLRVWLVLAAAALLTACASPITTRVTSFNQWPADAAGSTFSYITPMDTTRQLEQATYEGYVQAELEKRGLQRAPAGQAGRLQVDVTTSSRSDEKTWLQPVYQDNMVFIPPYRDAAGRFYGGGWVPDPFGPRYIGDRQMSMTIYTSSLRLRLLDTKDTPPGKPPRTVFESRAMYEGGTSELPLVVPYLVRAVFDDFPGQNGQVRIVKFDSETGALIKK